MAKFMIAALALVALLGFVEAVPVVPGLGLDILGNAHRHAEAAVNQAAGAVVETAAVVGLGDGLDGLTGGVGGGLTGGLTGGLGGGLGGGLTGGLGGGLGGGLTGGLGAVGGVTGQAQAVAGGLPLPLPVGRK